jgi:hypothetical protein
MNRTSHDEHSMFEMLDAASGIEKAGQKGALGSHPCAFHD